MQIQHNQAAAVVEDDQAGDDSSAVDSGGGGAVGAADDSKAASVPSNWPDNWRELYAGGDEKKLSQLSRYASPSAAFDGLIATKQKLSSGEYKSTDPFPEKGTDDEKNAWREQNGIPTEASAYGFDGIQEQDQEFINALGEYALGKNIPKQYANDFVEFLKAQDQQAQEFDAQADHEAQQTFEDKMRAEWGNDYRRNINMIHGLLDTGPAGMKDYFLNSRGPDGNPLGSNPQIAAYLADLAFQINPITTLVPNSGGNAAQSLADEIEAIEAKMGTKEYSDNEKMQQRYRDLISARERIKVKEK